MRADEVEALRRRLDTLTRAAARLRAHAGDLHDLGWEPHRGEAEKVNGGSADRTPRAGDPRARRLFDRVVADVEAAEAELVGDSRMMLALFTARAERPDPSRGSTISLADFDDQLARQRKRPGTPVRLEPQPRHPGMRP